MLYFKPVNSELLRPTIIKSYYTLKRQKNLFHLFRSLKREVTMLSYYHSSKLGPFSMANPAAVHRFSKNLRIEIKKGSVRVWKKTYLAEVDSQVQAGNAVTIMTLPISTVWVWSTFPHFVDKLDEEQKKSRFTSESTYLEVK